MTGRSARVLAVGLFGVLSVLTFPRSCQACSCVFTTAAEARDRADVVFRGRVVEVEAPSRWRRYLPGDAGWTKEVRLQADTVWKGPVRAEFLVEGGTGQPDCSVQFAPGVEYLVYAVGRGDGVLDTSSCSGTVPLKHVVVPLADLGPGQRVPASTPTPLGATAEAGSRFVPMVLAASGVGVAALAVGLVVRSHTGNRRRPRSP